MTRRPILITSMVLILGAMVGQVKSLASNAASPLSKAAQEGESRELFKAITEGDPESARSAVRRLSKDAVGRDRARRRHAIERLQRLTQRRLPDEVAIAVESTLILVAESELQRRSNAGAKLNDRGEVIEAGLACTHTPLLSFAQRPKGLDSLKVLSIQGLYDAEDLEILELCPGLQELTITGATLHDRELMQIKRLLNLRSLRFIDCNNISGDVLNELGSLRNLRKLWLSGKQVRSLEVIRGATQLEYLYCDARELRDEDLRPLQEVTGLKTIVLIEARHITDAGLTYLSGLHSLQELTIIKSALPIRGSAHFCRPST